MGRGAAVDGGPCFTTTYEDLWRDFDTEIGAILEFLEVDKMRLSSSYVKQNTHPLTATVANWQEVRRAVRESEFAYTLFLPE